MDEQPLQPRQSLLDKTSEKNLSKEEIIDILKRNIELYQKEPDFARYLAEMAAYLILFRYDPKKAAPERADVAEKPISSDTAGGSVIYSLSERFKTKGPSQMMCQYCGGEKKPGGRCRSCGL